MRVLITAALLICCYTAVLTGQRDSEELSRRLAIGIAYSGLTDSVERLETTYRERDIQIYARYELNDRFALNLKYNTIFSTDTRLDEKNRNQVGILALDYDLIHRSKHDLVFRMGYARGDYCTCGDAVPYTRSGTNYLHYGGDLAFSILRTLRLSVGFDSNYPLGKIEDKYSYNLILVGVGVYLY